MAPNRRKLRVNLSVDPDIYRETKRRFEVMDLSMSAFIEQQMVVFLRGTEPFKPLIDAIKEGKEVDPVDLKVAVRSFQAASSTLLGDSLSEFGSMSRQMGEFLADDTDEK